MNGICPEHGDVPLCQPCHAHGFATLWLTLNLYNQFLEAFVSCSVICGWRPTKSLNKYVNNEKRLAPYRSTITISIIQSL